MKELAGIRKLEKKNNKAGISFLREKTNTATMLFHFYKNTNSTRTSWKLMSM